MDSDGLLDLRQKRRVCKLGCGVCFTLRVFVVCRSIVIRQVILH